MEWDQAKIDAAVSTLTEDLGATCVVTIETECVVREICPVTDADGIPWRQYEPDPLQNKVIITITLKDE